MKQYTYTCRGCRRTTERAFPDTRKPHRIVPCEHCRKDVARLNETDAKQHALPVNIPEDRATTRKKRH
jgi:hypothetical protein